MPHFDNQGNEITAAQVRAAVEAGAARLVHSHGWQGKTLTALSLDCKDIDTRGQCHAMSDEVWTTLPSSLAHALWVARA